MTPFPALDLDLERIGALMVRHGIPSVAELARRAEMDRTLCSRLVNGRRPARPHHVAALAAALEVDPEQITTATVAVA